MFARPQFSHLCEHHQARSLSLNSRGHSTLFPLVGVGLSPVTTNVGSQSYNYAMPILHLPGRNGTRYSASYGQGDTSTAVANRLSSTVSAGSLVNASTSGCTISASSCTISLTAKTTGAGTNYSLSSGSSTAQPATFSQPSFTMSTSSTKLTGGADNAIYSLVLSSYAPNGNVMSANDSVNGNWTYGYDQFNRVVSANQNSGQFLYNFVYDVTGNRWQQNGFYHPPNLNFTGNNNRIDGYSYDLAGNLLNDGSTAYTYDAENQIVRAGTSSYVYDANGRRVRKTTGGASVDFLYDLGGHEVTEISSTGGWNRGEIYAGARHLATYWNSTTYFTHADWIGTERVRSNVSGGIFNTCTNLVFGDWLICSNPDPSPMHFTGQEHDFDTGLDNFHARYNASAMGRFMSPDPNNAGSSVDEPQSWNAYAYVLNNPINLVDPSGLGHCEYITVSDTTSANSNSNAFVVGGHTETNEKKECKKNHGQWVDDDSQVSAKVTANVDGPAYDTTRSPIPSALTFIPNVSQLIGSNSSANNSNNQDCIQSIFNPTCKPPKRPSCLAVFADAGAAADPLEKLGLGPTPPGAGLEDAAKATTAALAARHIIQRGLAVPLRSSIVRNILLVGEGVATVFAYGPVIYQLSTGVVAEAKARYSGTCRTAWDSQ